MPQQDVFDLAAQSGGQTQKPKTSALEELAGQDVFDQAAKGSSALEDLVNGFDSGPTDAQKTYRKATAAGPFTPPGAAEKAMGQQFGDNRAQAKQALKDTAQAAAMTAGGVGLASALPATPAAIKAVQAMATDHPVAAALVKRALQTVGAGEAIKHHKWLIDLLP